MERNNKKRCEICNKEISKTNWSRHIKTNKHLEGIRENEQSESNERSEFERSEIKHCVVCDIDILNNDWNEHLKSLSHKNNTRSIKKLIRNKVKSFSIIRHRRRNFLDFDFETDDYIIKKIRRSS
jgi:hypothetical protein